MPRNARSIFAPEASCLRGATAVLSRPLLDLQDGVKTGGRGWCVVFETSVADAFMGEERDANEYLDYILLDVSLLASVLSGP